MRSVSILLRSIASALVLLSALDEAPAQNNKSAAPKACSISQPPAGLGLDPFYKKYCIASGIPILSSEHVPDAALQMAAEIATQMLSAIPAVRDKLIAIHSRIAIIGKDQVTSDIPEHKPSLRVFPDLDRRTRGIASGVPDNPVTSGAEENLLCYQMDRYRGEN